MSSRSRLFVIFAAVFALLCTLVILYALEMRSWNAPLSTEYSPKFEANEHVVSRVRSITLFKSCSWDNCASYKTTFHSSGDATYVGLKDVENIGTFTGKTSEFPNLATWIESLHLETFKEDCSDGIVSVQVVMNDKEKNYSKCNPNTASIEFRAMINAIDEAASRVNWHK